MLTLSQTHASPVSDPCLPCLRPMLTLLTLLRGLHCICHTVSNQELEMGKGTRLNLASSHGVSCSSAAKPIDLLAKYVNMTEDDLDIEVQEPYHLLRVGNHVIKSAGHVIR